MSLLLVAALLTANPTVQTPAETSEPAAAVTKPKKEKKICRADPTETGSHMVKRICLTQEQWDAQRGRTTDEFNATMPNGR